MKLLQELQRRNVFRVAGTYAVVGWLVAQVATTLEESLELPGWFDATIVTTLLLGFPVAIVLAWAFELTRDGVRRTASSEDAEPASMRAIDYGVILGLVVVTALMSWQIVKGRSVEQPVAESRVVSPKTTDTPAVVAASIAVLPFADLSQAGDQQYFSDGIAEEILNVLARVDGLKVASRTSSFQYKDRADISLPEIARELGVAHVLEGSIRKAGNTIRVTAQLIRAGEDEHIWSDTFDRDLTVENLFQIQDDIATGIVGQLGQQMQLGRVNTQRFAAAADTKNLRAYELYLEGLEQMSTRSTQTLPGIIQDFEMATELDPKFARAWEALAAARFVAPAYIFGDDATLKWRTDAQLAAKQALELDPMLPLAIAVSAGVDPNAGNLDHETWLEALDKGLAVDPNEAVLIGWKGQELTWLGYFAEGERALRRALELDQGDWISKAWLVRNLVLQQRLDEAYDVFQSSKKMQSQNAQVNGMLALALYQFGREDAAVGIMSEHLPPQADLQTLSRALFQPVDDPSQASADFIDALGPLGNALFAQGGLPTDLRHALGDFASIKASASSSWEMIVWLRNRPDFLDSPHRYRLMEEQGLVAHWRKYAFPPQCSPIDPLPDGRDFACE